MNKLMTILVLLLGLFISAQNHEITGKVKALFSNVNDYYTQKKYQMAETELNKSSKMALNAADAQKVQDWYRKIAEAKQNAEEKQEQKNTQAKHNYLSGRCKLVGALRAESGYCPGCAEDDKKNREAKIAEDNRVAAIAKKEAEAKLQKAIDENKKENARIAAESKKQKENELHYGSGGSEKKVEKTSISSNNKNNTVKEKLTILQEGGKGVSYLVNKNGDKLLTVSNASLYNLDAWADNNNLFEIREGLDIGYDDFHNKSNIIDEKGTKRIKREDVVDITSCKNGFYLLVVPGWKSDEIRTDYWNKKSVGADYQFIVYDAKNNKEYPLIYRTYDWSSRKYNILPNDDSSKLSKNWTEVIRTASSPKEDILVIVNIEPSGRDANKTGNDKDFYYFDLKDKKWKTLIQFPTYDDWKIFTN